MGGVAAGLPPLLFDGRGQQVGKDLPVEVDVVGGRSHLPHPDPVGAADEGIQVGQGGRFGPVVAPMRLWISILAHKDGAMQKPDKLPHDALSLGRREVVRASWHLVASRCG